MQVIGLTGLIGSGKTTVANLFGEYGVSIIDTDLIAHQLTMSGGAAIPFIQSAFGNEVIATDGALLRAKMREKVFGDTDSRNQLEQILHPLILQEVKLKLAEQNGSYLIVVVPLLFRTPSYLELMQRNIFVDCDYAVIIQRLKLRNNFSQQQIEAILSAQLSRETQLALADDIIYNPGEIDDLQRQVGLLHEKYIKIFAAN